MPWYSTTESSYIYTNETTWTAGDSIRTRVTIMDWSATAAANMRHVATEGTRFTLNFADNNNNLSATTRHTTDMPNPYFDRDLAASKCGEAEITSESSSFPSSTATYFGNYWFTRWYWNGAAFAWNWNNAGGTIEYGEQLSRQYPGAGDKWDTASPTYGGNAIAFIFNHPYPPKARPVGNPPASADPCQYDGEPLDGLAAVVAGTPAPRTLAHRIAIDPGDQVGEAIVRPDLTEGLDAYAEAARNLAIALARGGPARGVITFARPVTSETLDAIAALGVEIHTAESVSSPMLSGNRMTFGDTYSSDYWRLMAASAKAEGAEMLGIVSAEVFVPDLTAYLDAAEHPDVYLIDLSSEQVRRSDRAVNDVALNDVYWYLAGWDTP